MPESEAQLLHCNVVKAADLFKTETFSRADPYVVMKMGSKQARTKTKREAGRNPTFGESFEFGYENENQLMFFVYDEESGRTDVLIGAGDLSLQTGTEFSGDIPLTRKGKGKQEGQSVDAGKLTVNVRVRPQ